MSQERTRSAVLFDSGGVLTSSVVAAFDGLGAELDDAPRLPLHPDHAMIALEAKVRADGHRVGLLSNSLGDDCYAP
ncbi:hypothetical protein [Streptomyces sp. NPDC018059]|uniref:hypothetical protein n=1 Tax=Streptomyces sp. NPDC018059 TaxID=3365041 RepID=UPI00379D8C22